MMVEMEETCYHAFHCAGNNLIMRLRTFCPSWVNWGMNISYDVSKILMMNKTMFKSGGQCLGSISSCLIDTMTMT